MSHFKPISQFKKSMPFGRSQVKAGKPRFIDNITDDLSLQAVNMISHYYDERGELSSAGNFARKEVYSNEVEKYYLRIGTKGSKSGFLMKVHGGDFYQGDENKYATERGEHLYKWTQVTEKAFNFYLQYLKTRNEALYLNADRSK